MIQQKFPLGPELKVETVQRNLEELHWMAHIHHIRESAPSEKEGSVGDIVLVGTSDLYVKFPSGWKRFEST